MTKTNYFQPAGVTARDTILFKTEDETANRMRLVMFVQFVCSIYVCVLVVRAYISVYYLPMYF